MKEYRKFLRTGNFINRNWHDKGKGKSLKVFNKYDHSVIATVPYASARQVEDAISGAVRGFNEFRTWSAGKKADYLYELIDLLKQC